MPGPAAALSPDLFSQLTFVLERTRDAAAMVEEEVPAQALRELQLMATTSLVVLSGGSMDFNNLVHLIGPMVRLDRRSCGKSRNWRSTRPNSTTPR